MPKLPPSFTIGVDSEMRNCGLVVLFLGRIRGLYIALGEVSAVPGTCG